MDTGELQRRLLIYCLPDECPAECFFEENFSDIEINSKDYSIIGWVIFLFSVALDFMRCFILDTYFLETAHNRLK